MSDAEVYKVWRRRFIAADRVVVAEVVHLWSIDARRRDRIKCCDKLENCLFAIVGQIYYRH